MKITDLLVGTTILEKTHSKYSGKIEVIRDLTWGTYIKVGGLTQSGGILTKVWQETLKEILKKKPHVQNCLILGFGGGSAARLVSQYWVGAKIMGVDIDNKMVDLGKKYLGLDKVDINIEIEDAYEFAAKANESYDLIIIDLYCGDKFPEKFEDEKFLRSIFKLLSLHGVAIFNRLYGGDKRPSAMKFGAKLEKIFKKVEYFYPQANLELICYN